MKKYKMKKSVILISVAGTLLLIIALVLVGRNVKEKKANTLVITEEHVRAYVYGYDGFGIGEPFMDRTKLYEDVMKIYEAHPDEDRTDDYLRVLDTLFELRINKSVDLSNGDMVEIEVIPNVTAFKEMGSSPCLTGQTSAVYRQRVSSAASHASAAQKAQAGEARGGGVT